MYSVEGVPAETTAAAHIGMLVRIFFSYTTLYRNLMTVFVLILKFKLSVCFGAE